MLLLTCSAGSELIGLASFEFGVFFHFFFPNPVFGLFFEMDMRNITCWYVKHSIWLLSLWKCNSSVPLLSTLAEQTWQQTFPFIRTVSAYFSIPAGTSLAAWFTGCGRESGKRFSEWYAPGECCQQKKPHFMGAIHKVFGVGPACQGSDWSEMYRLPPSLATFQS